MEKLFEIIQNSNRPQRIGYSHTVVGIDLCHASAVLQGHRVMAWFRVGKGPVGIISPDSCWKHAQLQQAAQDHVLYWAYSVSKDGDPKICLGNAVQCFTTLPFPVFQSILVVSCPVTAQTVD